jgi:inner membrane protein
VGACGVFWLWFAVPETFDLASCGISVWLCAHHRTQPALSRGMAGCAAAHTPRRVGARLRLFVERFGLLRSRSCIRNRTGIKPCFGKSREVWLNVRALALVFQFHFRVMPSIISHPAVAIGLWPILQRFRVPPLLFWVGAFCTIVPDFDVITFAFGVSYGEVLGHRGFTHSLLFAALLSVILTQVFWPQHASKPACFWFLFLCTASHGVLDAMTSGGMGVAFWAPFDNTRYFFPWRPIRVSPLSVRQFFGPRGVAVIGSEILWIWIPAFLVALAAKVSHRFSNQA